MKALARYIGDHGGAGHMTHADTIEAQLAPLAALAAGRMPPELALLLRVKAALDPMAGALLRGFEAEAGAALERETPAALAPGSLDAVLARLPERTERGGARAADEFAAFPAPLAAACRRAAARQSWQRAGRGVRYLPLTAGEHDADGIRLDLLRIEPGRGVPRHTHEGQEITLVVTGAFRDEAGRYGPGDIALATPEITHRPVAEPGETCHALALTDAGLRFTGVLGLIQRVTGN